jgi:hypothetical protein
MSDVIERPNAMQSFIERASRDDSFNLDKFRELLVMQREENQLRARHEFNAAMAAVQSELQTIVRDRENTHTRSRYATLQTIDAAARPVYTRHGFSVRFGTAAAPWEGWVRVTCELAHVGGYSEQHHLDGPLDAAGSQGKSNKTAIQAIGSTISYLRRYLLLLVLNLVTVDDDDDDGEASRRQPTNRREEINHDVPMRAAATSMPRAERVVDPTVYDAPAKPTAERTDEAWRLWLTKLRDACAVLYHRQEVVEVGERASVGDAMATGPEWVRREISGILAENYKRFSEEPEADLSDEALGDVEIAGAEKLAAG